MLFITPLSAGEGPEYERKVSKQITRKMDYPENELEGNVYTQFQVTREGEILIIDVLSSNADLAEFVKNELNQMRLKIDAIATEEVFNLNFVFKQENINKF